MKKLVLNCQKKVEEALNSHDSIQNQIDNQALISLQEGLTICISKVPSKQGFPFDLPAVNFVSKLVLSSSFLKEATKHFEATNIEKTLLLSILELEQTLVDFLSAGILTNIREIKVLNTNFLKLRKILDDEDTSSRQIKEKLALFYRQLKKHQIKHPKLEVIAKRIKKYFNNLFHCYDDDRIPRTNLEIERSFNSLKRTVRKRAGVQNRKSFFSHEGKALVQIENLTSEYKYDISETKFINHFKSKRLLVDFEKLKKQSILRQNDKLFLKMNYQKKISVQEAGLKFQKIKTQFKLI